MYALLISAEFVVVEVVDDDVVGSSLPVAQSTRRLPSSASEELDAAFGLELPLLPVAVGLLKSEVGYDALVELQLSLYVSEESVGRILGLTDDDHEIDEPLGLEHEPKRHEDVEVCGLGVSSWPHEDRL